MLRRQAFSSPSPAASASRRTGDEFRTGRTLEVPLFRKSQHTRILHARLAASHPARHHLAQDGLEQPKKKKGDPTIRIHLLKFAAASALVALTAASTPARANEMIHNLGPVGPHEPILATVGTKQVIAFYLPYSDGCAVHTVIWNTTDADRLSAAHSAERVRIGLKPGQIVHIDSADNVSLGLQCGDNAATLAVVDRDEHIVFGTSIPKHVKPNASRF